MNCIPHSSAPHVYAGKIDFILFHQGELLIFTDIFINIYVITRIVPSDKYSMSAFTHDPIVFHA